MTNAIARLRRAFVGVDDRWRNLPLRKRLTAAAAAAATLAILAVVGVAYIAVRHELRIQIDKNLRQQAAEVRLNAQPQIGGGFTISLDESVGEIRGYVQAIDTQGHVDRSRLSDPVIPVAGHDKHIALHGGVWYRDRSINGIHMRVITVRSNQFRDIAVLIAVPMTGVDRQLHTLAFAFALLAVGGLLLTVLLSWGAVRRVTRPIRSLTEAAEQIATTRDLSVRIESEGSLDDELGRLGATFNSMLDELDRSLRAQRQLVTDASHELRTPLASLRTNVEVLNDVERLAPDQRRAVLSGITTQLDELTGLVADVVELARGEAPPAEHEDLNLDELVAHAVDRARRHWPAVEFQLSVEPVRVRGVARRLDRAVANMLDNAAKFSPAGGVVGVRLTGDGALTVADQGPGIPEEALPHVFDRFFRADEARSLPGSGLGLAIVAQVAEGHGGSINLANRPDGGAIATLRLPTTEPDELPRPVVETAPDDVAVQAPTRVPMPVEESLFR